LNGRNWLVANLHETRHLAAYLGNGTGPFEKLPRGELPARLYEAVEATYARRMHE
jgi:hypothetical protein